MELAPKAQVLGGRGIKGHFEIQSLRNGISRGFQEIFSTADAMLFRESTWNTDCNGQMRRPYAAMGIQDTDWKKKGPR